MDAGGILPQGRHNTTGDLALLSCFAPFGLTEAFRILPRDTILFFDDLADFGFSGFGFIGGAATLTTIFPGLGGAKNAPSPRRWPRNRIASSLSSFLCDPGLKGCLGGAPRSLG